MFFKSERRNFFRPLNSKWREVIVACLKEFYQRLYSPESDYTDHINRTDLRQLFLQVIRRTPAIGHDADAFEQELGLDPSTELSLAGSLITVLEREGWIERYTDKTALLTAFRFSRAGKLFAEAFISLDGPRGKTRQRNVRNTRNALQAFRDELDPYDLVDALEYSQRIVLDISDDIAFLNELKQDLLQTAMERAAVVDFLDFMERHFRPDLSVRLAADSVEKHRNKIMEIIEQIRELPEDARLSAAARTQPLLPDYFDRELPPEALLDEVLDRIERTLDAACDAKLPQLRAALNGFIKRSVLISKQAASIIGGMNSERISQAIEKLGRLPEARQEAQLLRTGQRFMLPLVRLVDPAAFRLRRTVERPVVDTFAWIPETTREALMQAAIAEAESMAFNVSPTHIKRSLIEQLRDSGEIMLSQLPGEDVPSLLALTHAIEAVSAMAEDNDMELTLRPLLSPFSTRYMTSEDFVIQRVDGAAPAPDAE